MSNVEVARIISAPLKFAAAQRILAIVLLIVIAPLLLIIAFVLLVINGSPVLYRHRRVGQNGRDFYCYKFRTMVRNADEVLKLHLAQDPTAAEEWRQNHKLRNDPRVGAVGRFMRATSLDEIPQLINIARGEMAFVGPRPIVHAEIEKYGRHFQDYCEVKPGLTGLWQISGRSDTSYPQRVALDVEYVRSRSALLDLRIIFLTIPSVLLRKGSF